MREKLGAACYRLGLIAIAFAVGITAATFVVLFIVYVKTAT